MCHECQGWLERIMNSYRSERMHKCWWMKWCFHGMLGAVNSLSTCYGMSVFKLPRVFYQMELGHGDAEINRAREIMMDRVWWIERGWSWVKYWCVESGVCGHVQIRNWQIWVIRECCLWRENQPIWGLRTRLLVTALCCVQRDPCPSFSLCSPHMTSKPSAHRYWLHYLLQHYCLTLHPLGLTAFRSKSLKLRRSHLAWLLPDPSPIQQVQTSDREEGRKQIVRVERIQGVEVD